MNGVEEPLNPGEQVTMERLAVSRLEMVRNAMMGSAKADLDIVHRMIPYMIEAYAYMFRGVLIDVLNDESGSGRKSKILCHDSADLQNSLIAREDLQSLLGYIEREKDEISRFLSKGGTTEEFLLGLIEYRAEKMGERFGEMLKAKVDKVFSNPDSRIMPNRTTKVETPSLTVATAPISKPEIKHVGMAPYIPEETGDNELDDEKSEISSHGELNPLPGPAEKPRRSIFGLGKSS